MCSLFLPDTVWCCIFEMLEFPPSLASVCKDWRRIYSIGFRYSFTKRIFLPKTFFRFPRYHPRLNSFIDGLSTLVWSFHRSINSLFYKDLHTASVALSSAAYLGRADLVTLILNSDLEITSVSISSAVQYSVSSGNVEATQLLLQDSRLSEYVPEALLTACKLGHLQLVILLLNNRRTFPPPDHRNCYGDLLVAASESGKLNVINFLLSTFEYPERQICRALEIALQFGQVEVAQLLVGKIGMGWIGYENTLTADYEPEMIEYRAPLNSISILSLCK